MEITKAFITIILIFSVSCKKEPVSPPRTPTEILLEHTWTPVSARIYIHGEYFQLLTPISETYTSDGKVIYKQYVYSTIKDLYVARFKVMPDDTTILFYAASNGVADTAGYPSIIKTLTDNSLVMYTYNNDTLTGIDSLKR